MGKRFPLRALRLMGLFVTLPLLALAALASEPGSLERHYLEEAARGNLDDVFLIRMFGGYVAFPRTFVLAFGESGKIRILSDLHKDSTLTRSSVDAGVVLRTPEGQLEDAATQEPLAIGPSRSEQRGRLTIQSFSPTAQRPTPVVIIRDDSQYLRLFGSATLLVKDLVETYEALTGPPSVFDAALRDRAARECQSDAVSVIFESGVYGSQVQVRLRVQPGPDISSFRQTGLRPDDVITAVDDKPWADRDFYQVLRDVIKGRKVTFSIERGGSHIRMVPTAEQAKAALGRCH